MSIKTMNRVWEHSKVGGSELLVLLAIADFAHDDGSGAWPSTKTLGRKCKLSQRQVQRIIQQLEKARELGIERRAGPHGTNMYTVLSGLKTAENTRKCYMCESPEGEVDLEDHHTIPEDDSSIVLLCKQCHYKVTALQRGYDKMSYDKHDASDMTSDAENMTQSCHPNHHEPSSNHHFSADADKNASTHKDWTHEDIQYIEMVDAEDRVYECAQCGETFDVYTLLTSDAACFGCKCPIWVTDWQGNTGFRRPKAGLRKPRAGPSPWLDLPVKGWCALAGKPYNELSYPTKLKLAGKFQKVGGEAKATAEQVYEALKAWTANHPKWTYFDWPGKTFCNILVMDLMPDIHSPEPEQGAGFVMPDWVAVK